MEKKYIILILIIIYFALVLFVKCNENFESNVNYKPLTTNISNILYSIDKKDNVVLLTNFNKDLDYSKIYELENIFNEKYYNIYLKDNILKYIDEKKIGFILDGAQNISSFPEFYKLYKTFNNKLYYKINNQNKYLVFDKNNIKTITLSYNEEDGIIWNF
jgi:hypothetical protein